MPKLIIIAEFDNRDRPLQVLVYDAETDKLDVIPCYSRGTGLLLDQIDENLERVRLLFLDSITDATNDGPNTIVTNQFRDMLRAFELPIPDGEYKVYDMASTIPHDKLIINIKRLDRVPLCEWQKVFANSAVVYHELERTGLIQNELERTPIWLQDTVTGRSTCSNFNIQGLAKNDDVVSVIRTSCTTECDLLLHFDWIAADIMVAAYMSQDEALLEAFQQSDPYTYLAKCLSKPRSECKIMMLEDLYSHNFKSDVFLVYSRLKIWLMERIQLMQQTELLRTFMGRIFRLGDNNKERQRKVFNYTLQGGTAHLMQAALCQMRRIPNVQIVADLHDGLVLICPDTYEVPVLKQAMKIMSRPLATHDICMSFRVSRCLVRDGWHNWIPKVICRDGKRWQRAVPVIGADNG